MAADAAAAQAGNGDPTKSDAPGAADIVRRAHAELPRTVAAALAVDTERLLSNAVSRNLFVWGALGLCLVLIGAAVYLPGLAGILGLAGLGVKALALGASLLPLLGGQLWIGFTKSDPVS